MIGLDTNILLRWLMADADGSDPQQTALVSDLLSKGSEPLLVNPIVVVEVIWVLKRALKMSRSALIDCVKKILDAKAIVTADRDIVILAMDYYLRYPGDFSDHLIAAINQQHGCRTTMTFDKAVSKSPLFSQLQR